MKTTTDEDDDMSEAADAHLEAEDSAYPKETDVICPLSGEPVLEYKSAWDFPGYPEACFRKEIAKRKMSAEDYRKILKSGDEGVKFEGFNSKENDEHFSAKVRYNKDKVYQDEPSPGCEFVKTTGSGPRVVTETNVMCPKSGKPARDIGGAFTFPGYPGLLCWKTKAARTMSVEDYAKVLSSKAGAQFTGFISTNTNKPFKATLKYSAKGRNGKPSIEFDFDKPHQS